jgi:hypothetical protein
MVHVLAGSVAATGRVAFFDGPVDVGAVAVYSNEATSYGILFKTMGPGTHTITARYSGDNTFIPSDATAVPITATAN